MSSKEWKGKDVRVVRRHEDVAGRTPILMSLTERAARDLALAVRKLRQTSLMAPETVDEIADALDYVLVGDPASRAKHARMEAGKGMEPAGGDPRSYREEESFPIRRLTDQDPRDVSPGY